MNRPIVFGLLILLGACSQKPTTDDLKMKIHTILSQQTGEFAVAFKDLQTGNLVLINEHTERRPQFPSWSTG